MTARVQAMWFLVVFASITSAIADDWYVDNISGNNRQKGFSSSQPLQTIQAALLLARPGDRIVLKKTPEPYREQISVMGSRNSGFQGRPLEIVGNGAVLEGADPIRSSDWETLGNDLFQFRPARLSHQMLYQNSVPLEKVSPPNDNLADMQPLQWTQRDGWIIVRTEPGKAPYQYNFSCCARTVGITLYDAHDVAISDLTIQGFQLDGINAHDRVNGISISSCVLRGNGRSGLSVGGASRVAVASSLIGDNGRSQVRTEEAGRLNIDNCDIIGADSYSAIDRQGGTVVQDGQPLVRQ